MGPVPALMGIVPPQSHFSTAGKPADLWGFPVSVGPYHSKPVSAVCVPQWDKFPTLYQQVNRLTQWQQEGRDVLLFYSRGSLHSDWRFGGLIWLRHARARMGHQVVAFPTVRYILRGGRNRSVAVNSLSLIEIWETCTLLLKHPPHIPSENATRTWAWERGWIFKSALPP